MPASDALTSSPMEHRHLIGDSLSLAATRHGHVTSKRGRRDVWARLGRAALGPGGTEIVRKIERLCAARRANAEAEGRRPPQSFTAWECFSRPVEIRNDRQVHNLTLGRCLVGGLPAAKMLPACTAVERPLAIRSRGHELGRIQRLDRTLARLERDRRRKPKDFRAASHEDRELAEPVELPQRSKMRDGPKADERNR